MQGEKFFRVYSDKDVLADLPTLDKDGNDTLVDSAQDDDVESDDEVVRSGVQTSFRDLLVVKDYMKVNPEKVRVALRTFRLWAPLFGGRMPYLHEKKYVTDRSRSHLTTHKSLNNRH